MTLSVGDNSRVKPVVLKTLSGRFSLCIGNPSVPDTNPTRIYSNSVTEKRKIKRYILTVFIVIVKRKIKRYTLTVLIVIVKRNIKRYILSVFIVTVKRKIKCVIWRSARPGALVETFERKVQHFNTLQKVSAIAGGKCTPFINWQS